MSEARQTQILEDFLANGIATNPSGGSSTEVVNKWGEQFDIDTADAALGQVIWPVKATDQAYLFIDTPIQLQIVSDDIADDDGGTGANTVKVQYQDSDGKAVIETITMNGTTAVELADTSYGCFRMSVETSGSGNTNAGQIVIEDSSNNIYATIEPDEGQTQIAVFRIPSDKNGRIVSHECSYGRTGGSNEAYMRLRIRKTDGTIITKWDPIITTVIPKDLKEYTFGGVTVNPGEWVFWECIDTSANSTPVRGTFDIELTSV